MARVERMGLLIGFAASLVIGFWLFRSAVSRRPLELLGHLLADVVLLILLLTQTGGISNPLISYLLVLLAVSATILPRLMVLSFAAGSIAIYTFFLLIDLSSGQQMSMGSEGQAMTFQAKPQWVHENQSPKTIYQLWARRLLDASQWLPNVQNPPLLRSE